MVIFRILDRYLVKKIATHIVLTLLGLVSFSLIIRVTEEFSSIGKGSYTLVDAIIFSIGFSFPDISIYFPMAGLIGTMLALGKMANTQELIIVQSVGISRLRVLLSFLWFVIPFSAINLALQEYVTPYVTSHALNMKASKVNNSNFYTNQQSLWAKAQQEFVYATLDNKYLLKDVLVLRFNDSNQQLSEVILGKQAQWNKDTKQWIVNFATVYNFDAQAKEEDLKNVDMVVSKIKDSNVLSNELIPQIRQQLATSSSFRIRAYQDLQWTTEITPDKLSLVTQDISNFSLSNLKQYFKFLEKTNQNTSIYKYLYWSKIFSGISFFVMLFLATSTIFGNMRNQSLMLKFFIAVIIGAIFFVINSTIGPALITYNIPAQLAALLPSILFFIVGLVVYYRAR